LDGLPATGFTPAETLDDVGPRRDVITAAQQENEQGEAFATYKQLGDDTASYPPSSPNESNL